MSTVNDYDDPKVCGAFLEQYTGLAPSFLGGLAYVDFGSEKTRVTLPSGGRTMGVYFDDRRVGHIDNPEWRSMPFGLVCALVKLSRLDPDNLIVQDALNRASDMPFDKRVTAGLVVLGGQL